MKKNKRFIIILLLISFLISANLAWLNPRPNFNPLEKWSESVPLFWQYNTDSETFINTVVGFPISYREDKIMIQRPVYIMFARIVMYGIQTILSGTISVEHAAMLSYLLLNIGLYFLFSIVLFRLIESYLSKSAAKMALIFLLFHYFAITAFTGYHTHLFQFITPVLIAYLFNDVARNYSTSKNFLYSFWIGVLMLAKENYAIYLACLGIALWHRRYKEVGISFMVHVIPLLLWLDVLKVYDIPYYHHGYKAAGAISWLAQDFIQQPVLQMIKTVGQLWFNYLIEFTKFYSIFAPLFIIGLSYYWIHKKIEKKMFLFIGFFVLTTWLQIFVSNRPFAYMTADLSFLVFAISAGFITQIMQKWKIKKKKIMITALGGIWLLGNVIGTMNFPWAHPYEQHEYSQEAVTNLESYLKENPKTIFVFSKYFTLDRFINNWIYEDEWVRKFYIAGGEIHHNLVESYKSEAVGCRTYQFSSPYLMVRGSLINKHPEKISEAYFAQTEGEWIQIPVQEQLALDYTMYPEQFDASSFPEPYGRNNYFLRFCPKDPKDISYETALEVTTQVQYPKALVPILRQKSKFSLQIIPAEEI